MSQREIDIAIGSLHDVNDAVFSNRSIRFVVKIELNNKYKTDPNALPRSNNAVLCKKPFNRDDANRKSRKKA